MFVNNLRIFGQSKIILITLHQVQLKSVCAKFNADQTKSQGGGRFSSFCDFVKKVSNQKWARPSQSDSAPFRESKDTRFLNVQHSVWELYAKMCFPRL